jgi:pimeloyl-ACP methyl ester carboxylesterase
MSKWIVRLVLLLLAGSGCRESSDGDRPFLTRTFQTSDGNTAHYVLFVPPNRNPAEKLPVILFLNGWGENGNDGLRQISNNFGGDMWRMRAWFPFLAVCPQCTYNAEWTPGSANEKLALGVLDAAIREFNGDPDRVTITGASTGGTGALNIALANPDRFAAVVPISAPIHIDPDDLAESQLAIWSFHNGGDSLALVESARSSRQRHLKGGNSPLVTEFDLPLHNAWDSAYSSPALYRWLLQQRQSTNEPFDRFQLLKPEQVLAQWSAGDSGWKAEGDELVSRSGDSSRTLTSPQLTGDWAIHFDMQLATAAPALVKLFDDTNKATELQLRLSDEGPAELVLAHAHPVTVDPAAQRALRSGWNDVRLQSIAGRLTVTLNGWPAIENQPLGNARTRVRFAFDRGDGSKERRIRYLRMAQPQSQVRP